MKYSNSADILNNLEDSYCETKMNSVWDEYWVILAHYNFDIMVFSILFAYTNNMSNSGIKMCKSSLTSASHGLKFVKKLSEATPLLE